MNNSLFNTIFTYVEGHAKKIDEDLKYEQVEYHRTSVNGLINFHYPHADDPDWHVKCCYTLLIVAISEMECDIENLCKRGKYNRRCSYLDFGQYVPITSFKSFCSADSYEWVDKKFWYL